MPERWVGDRRTAPSRAAFARVFDALPADALCLSVGGGPLRAHSSFVNLNIGLFPNVDVVGDGYALPYSENSIDALHCEAVLEHMEYPQRAVDEMFRVTRPGARAWVATPFLQMFHAYPDHYQNFTLGGHVRLFERAGFTIEEAGACVGPTFMLRDLLQGYLRHIVPGGRFGRVLSRVAGLALLPFLFVDDLVGRRPASVVLASTTFLVARKPPGNLDPSGGIP
ncbi:MAG: methyltransferase domain-containing protein [Acidobacteriota bacterium]